MTWNGNHKYIPGDWWVICERCGFRYRKSEMRKEWTGLLVCAKNCWEPRHPQDFLRAVLESQPDPEFINPPNDASQIGQPGQITETTTLTSTSDSYQYIGHLDSTIDITLSGTGFDEGDEFFIIQYGSAPYIIYVKNDDATPVTLATIEALQHKKLTFEYVSSAWTLTGEDTV